MPFFLTPGGPLGRIARVNRRNLIFLAALLFAGPVLAGGKKPEKTQVSFHSEGSAAEGPKMSFSQAVQGRNVVFRRSPEIQTQDIAAFRPFQAEDGTFGATFLLQRPLYPRLEASTSSNMGKWMLAMFNGRPVDAVRINAPVKDGMIVVWQGIQLVEMQRMTHQWPFIGETQEQWKARLKTIKKNQK